MSPTTKIDFVDFLQIYAAKIDWFVFPNALISGHPGGVSPGKYAGMARDWSTLIDNFKPGMGGLDSSCTFVAGSPGEDPWEL